MRRRPSSPRPPCSVNWGSDKNEKGKRMRVGWKLLLWSVRRGCLMDGEQSGFDEGRGRGQGREWAREGREASGWPHGGWGSVARGELPTLRLRSWQREPRLGRARAASQALTFPSALENRAPKCPLGWDEPLAAALPVSFPDRCSYSPACTCGLLATHTLPGTCPWQSQALSP